MIRHTLDQAYAVGADGMEAVEMRSPLDLLMVAEEDLSERDAGLVRAEALGGVMAWILSAGPHPRMVAERLVACALRYAPERLDGLGKVDRLAVTATDGAARAVALARVLRDDERLRARDARRHGEAVNAALTRAYRGAANTWTGDLTRQADGAALWRMEEAGGADEVALRRATLARWCRLVWEQGARLGPALKAFYALARSYSPELMLNMSQEDVGAFFGQVRATTSAREKQLINTRLARAGYRKTTLRGQKSETACATYARRAQGNHNRAGANRKAA